MNFLFVCTGNTCRSAMASAILSHLAEKSGAEICADSCGIAAYPAPASQNAVLAVSELYGIDLSNHTAKMVSADLVEKADVIFAMTPRHATALISLFPDCADKLTVADPEIVDPYMQDLSIYKECAKELYSQINSRFFKEG
ncbi:MAG: low molecular weight protein arginine phosphatase [Oscillospiraceae bacterium]|nr:low molecular weight protein arginine phosphatase [Oscillospiraceae bacterium]